MRLLQRFASHFVQKKSGAFAWRERTFNCPDRLGERLGLEVLESRLAPTVTAVPPVGGLLTVNFGASNDVATILGTAPSGALITVSGTGLAPTPFAGVTSIAVTHTPATANQAVTLQTAAPNAILAPGGTLSVAGIATTTVNGVVNASTVTGDATTVNVQSGNGAKIQTGVNLAVAGATVNVANGTYTESNILVAKALTINGQSQAGVLLRPAIADAHDDSAFGGAAVSNGFVVQSNNVTVQNLTIDGNANGTLAGTQNFRAGVITDNTAPGQPFSGLTVQNVTVQNAFRRGIQVSTQRVGGSANQILNNTITGVTNPSGSGTGISIFGDSVVTGNTVGGAAAGALNDTGIGANGGPAIGPGVPNPVLTAQGNTLINNTTGFNLSELGANSVIGGPAAANANTVTMNGSGEVGVLLKFLVGSVTIQGNQISGSATDAGVWLQNNNPGAPPAVVIAGNVISTTGSTATTAGTGTGLFLFDDPTVTGENTAGALVATLRNNTVNGFVRGIDVAQTYATAPQNLTATLDGNTLGNNATGIRLLQTNAGVTVTATFVNTNTITGGATGLFVSGTGVTISGSTLATAAFAGETARYIDLQNKALAGTVLDARAVTFEGRTGAADTVAQNFAVEAKLHQKVEDPTVGLINFLDRNVFVVNTNTIANGFNAANPGDTLNVQGGTYAEAFNDTKGVNLLVASPDTVTINSLTGGGNSTVTLSGTGATLAFGDATNTTFAGTITGTGNLVKQGSGTFTLPGTSTYSGTTTVNGGILVVTGTLAAGGTVSVNNGATLTGTGTLSRVVAVNSGGTLAPSLTGPATLTVGGLTFQPGGTLVVFLNGPAAGTGYTQLVVTGGPVTLNNGTLQVNRGAFTPNAGSVITLIANMGGATITGNFSGLPEGGAFNLNGVPGFVTYTGNTGNDFIIAFVGPIAFPGGINGTNFVVRRSGSDVQTLIDGKLVDSRPLAAVTNLSLKGTDGAANSLTVDLGFGGYFTLAGVLSFQGGVGGTDPVRVTGGNLQTTTVAYTGPGAGSVGLFTGAPGSLQVAFTNATALDVTGDTTATLTFQLPGSPDSVTLTDRGDGGASSLGGTSGNFVATTYKDPTALLLLTAGPGNDALTLRRLAATTANYVLDAGGGTNNLTVDFSSETAADVVYLTATAIHANGLGAGNVYYRATGGNFGGAVTLSLGSGGNRVFLQGTQAGAPTLVQTGSGDDTVVVSSDPNPALGQLNTFAAPLTLDAGAGANLLLVSEAAKATSDTVWVTDHGVAFDGEQFTLFFRATGGTFARGIQVVEGTGNDTAIVQSQLPNVPTTVFGNGGDDIFRVAVTNASQYANLFLDGDAGNSMLQAFDLTGGATVRRRLTAGNQGTLELSYPNGGRSVINFQNMKQQFANVPLTEVPS